jgi:hypothetical protein
MSRFLQGNFKPKNPGKYVGDPKNIVYRSSWELRAMRWFDEHPNVVSWASEELVIPYSDRGTLDENKQPKLRRYFPDFLIKVKTKNGSIEVWVIEIKPLAETMPPQRGTKKEKRYLKEVKTFATNYSKWESAKRFCDKHNMKFKILTEKELGMFN